MYISVVVCSSIRKRRKAKGSVFNHEFNNNPNPRTLPPTSWKSSKTHNRQYRKLTYDLFFANTLYLQWESKRVERLKRAFT